jgi:putative drug exporter of the RND superfamily
MQTATPPSTLPDDERPSESGFLAGLGRTCFRRRRWVVVIWFAIVIVANVLGSAFGGEPNTDFQLHGSETDRAGILLEEGGFGGRQGLAGQVVIAAEQGIDDAEVTAYLNELLTEIESIEGVVVTGPFDEDAQSQVSPQGDVAFAEVGFGDVTSEESIELAEEIKDVYAASDPPEGVTVEFGGDMFAEEIEFSSEAFGFLAAAVILFVAFGSVLAMGLPLATALMGIAAGLAFVTLWSNVLKVPGFAANAVLIVAIGVGIDYALFIVTRYREELAAGRTPEQSVVTSSTTAGRAVIFAGTTVIISLLGLFVVGLDSMESLAVAMATGVFLVMLASITLLPALLGFVGHNIDKFGMPHRKSAAERSGEQSVWYRWSRFVQHRPWPILLVSLVILLVLAAPALNIRLGFGDAGNRPDSDTTRRAYDMLADGFGPGFNGPMFLAVDLSGDEAADEQVLERLATVGDTEGVESATPPIVNEDGTVAFVQVFPATSPQDADTEELVHRIRDDVVPAAVEGTDVEILVGGISAGVIDFAEYTFDKLPQFIAVVLVLSFLLLMAVFRSLLVPLKAVIMNLLSIGAAYGIIVAIFQEGWLGDFLGEPGPIDAWVPVMMFAVVFGLSMDYEVFLLSRMREEYLRTGDNATAVADGLARTARLITAAALIMVFVFGGFVLSADRGLRLFGLGMAVAVFVDATVVRLLLVPSTMELLGDRNWWLPKWLDRIVPHIGLD